MATLSDQDSSVDPVPRTGSTYRQIVGIRDATAGASRALSLVNQSTEGLVETFRVAGQLAAETADLSASFDRLGQKLEALLRFCQILRAGDFSQVFDRAPKGG